MNPTAPPLLLPPLARIRQAGHGPGSTPGGRAGWRGRLATAALALPLAWGSVARADDGPRMPSQVPPAYTAECASCHTAYPPGMLPAPSWRRIMDGLGKHYGTDATLDEPTLQQLSTWLQTHAGGSRRAREEPPEDRITRSAWFVREHREVNRAVWQDPAVKSAANCAACHTGADKGRFNEHELRIPPGLSPKLARDWHD